MFRGGDPRTLAGVNDREGEWREKKVPHLLQKLDGGIRPRRS